MHEGYIACMLWVPNLSSFFHACFLSRSCLLIHLTLAKPCMHACMHVFIHAHAQSMQAFDLFVCMDCARRYGLKRTKHDNAMKCMNENLHGNSDANSGHSLARVWMHACMHVKMEKYRGGEAFAFTTLACQCGGGWSG